MTQDPNAASPLLNLPGTGDAADIDLGGTPRPWWRRRGPIIGISVALLVILLGGLLFTLLNRKPPVKYEYQPVQIRNLALTISATGPLTSAVYNLVFNGQSGGVIIDEIDVKVGQKVVAGQVVAKLNKTSLQDVYNEQLAAVRTDQNNLNSAMNELLKTEGLTNANVASAQTSLSNSRASLTTTLAASQQAVVVAETTLSNDQANLIQVQNEAQASISVAQTTLSNDQTALTQVLSVSQASISAAQTTLSNAQASLAQATTVANAQIAQALLTEQTAIAACTTPPTQPCIQAAKDAYNVAAGPESGPRHGQCEQSDRASKSHCRSAGPESGPRHGQCEQSDRAGKSHCRSAGPESGNSHGQCERSDRAGKSHCRSADSESGNSHGQSE